MATPYATPEPVRVDRPSAPDPAAPAGLGRFGSRLGYLLIGLGLLAIFLGYNGAAGLTDLRAQFPYLISGGLAGLSFVVWGSAQLIAHSARQDAGQTQALLAELVAQSGAVREDRPVGGYAPAPRG